MNTDDDPLLPAPFVWSRIYQDPERRDVQVRLGTGGETVASVTAMNGAWYVTVNLHLTSHKVRGTSCASCQQGKRWVARWLAPRAGRILIDIGEAREREAPMKNPGGVIRPGP